MSTRHTGSRFARHLENIPRVTTKVGWRCCRIDSNRTTRHSWCRTVILPVCKSKSTYPTVVSDSTAHQKPSGDPFVNKGENWDACERCSCRENQYTSSLLKALLQRAKFAAVLLYPKLWHLGIKCPYLIVCIIATVFFHLQTNKPYL